jgi:zinc protease
VVNTRHPLPLVELRGQRRGGIASDFEDLKGNSMRTEPGRRTKLALLVLLVGLAGLPATVAADTPDSRQQTESIKLPAGIERVTSVEGITEYRLRNGLRLLVFPDRSQEIITVNITYLVGTRHENYGETGMAHLLEHLLFKGTPKHGNIWKEFNDRGAFMQGTTGFDRTNYYGILAATEENLDWALELEADRMVNSFIAKQDLDTEMTVVRNEMERKENSPAAVLGERVMATAFQWHNYGNHVLGARADVENVPIERLQDFYRTFYRPDNAVLIVAGKFSEQKVIELVHRYYSPIPRPERPLPAHYTAEPPQDGERQVTVRRVGDVQLAVAGYHAPPAAHADYAAVALAVNMLGHTPSGRLHKSLVETKKASTALADVIGLRQSGYVFFQANLRKEQSIADARDALLKAVDSLAAEPPTQEETERARVRILSAFEAVQRDPKRLGTLLSEWVAVGDWRLFFLHRDRIRKVSAADVSRVASAYLKPSNRTVGLFVPEEKPDRAAVPAVSDAEIAAMLQGYKGDAAVKEGEAFDPTPANIDARTVRSRIGDLQLALLPKKTRGGNVVLRLALQMGDEKSLMHRAVAGNMAGAMLLLGTSRRTRQQVHDEFDRLKARGLVTGTATAVAASIETTREGLPDVMRLLAEVLRHPSFPASELEQVRQQTLANIESQRSEPNAVALNAVARHVNPYPKGDVRYVGTFDEQIAGYKAVTLEQVRAFHRDFYGASHGQLTIVGDFDPKEMAVLAKELFGGWKNKTPYVRIAAEYRNFPAVSKSFETPDKANAFFIAYQPLKVRVDDPDYPALLMASNALAVDQYKNRLLDRLRQKEGISYGAGGDIQPGAHDPVGEFYATAIYAPQNADRVLAAFKDEFARALKDGFTAQELEDTRKGWMQAWRASLSKDGELAGHINSLLLRDRTLAWQAAFEAKVKTLTLDEVNRALRKYIDPERMILVKAGDFANAKRQASLDGRKE